MERKHDVELDELVLEIQQCEFKNSMNTSDKVLAQWLINAGYTKTPQGLVCLDENALENTINECLGETLRDLKYAIKKKFATTTTTSTPMLSFGVEQINNILLNNATGCKDVNDHHGKGKIEKGCTMCWAIAIYRMLRDTMSITPR
jgi:hypothetical protein